MTLQSYLKLSTLRPRILKSIKPAPDPILAAMNKMGADPATTVCVGDTINDMKAAHAAGAKFAGALYSSAANPDSIKDADFPLMKPAGSARNLENK